MGDSREGGVWIQNEHFSGISAATPALRSQNSLSPPRNRRRPAKPTQHSCHTFHSHTHTNSHSHAYAPWKNREYIFPCMCVLRVGGCWPPPWGTVILAANVGLILFNIVLSNHTLVQLDTAERGLVGALWLNGFPVMLRRQTSGLLSHHWLSPSLHLCLGAFSQLTTMLWGTWAQMLWRGGFELHSGDKVWACLVLLSPDGTVQTRDCAAHLERRKKKVESSEYLHKFPNTFWF